MHIRSGGDIIVQTNNAERFYAALQSLKADPAISRTRKYTQHKGTTTLQHCWNVAVYSFFLAARQLSVGGHDDGGDGFGGHVGLIGFVFQEAEEILVGIGFSAFGLGVDGEGIEPVEGGIAEPGGLIFFHVGDFFVHRFLHVGKSLGLY